MSAIHVTFRSVNDSPAIKAQINKHYSKINQLHPQMIHCRIVIDSEHNQHHHSKLYCVNIDATIPGKEVVAHKKNKSLYAALRDSFHTLDKLLNKYSRKKPPHIDKYLFYKEVDRLQNVNLS